MVGQSVSHYRINEKLGEGGMGVVFKAKDEQLGRWVAIKCLPPEVMRNEGRRARFLTEARVVSGLNHPNIVTIYDFVRDSRGEYIVMELVEGRTLDRLIPRGGMPLGEVLAIAEQIADALAAAHGASVVHRDLKPSNVMMTPTGRVKVLDFGLAKVSEPWPVSNGDETRTTEHPSVEGSVAGTVSYMSPEQAAGRPLDSRSDVFSFGLLLYEMLTGARAFHGTSAMETLASIMREEPKPLAEIAKDLPSEIERVVRRCLRKDPAKRWQTMSDLKLTLEELRAESDSGRLTHKPASSVRTPLRLWPMAVAGIAVLLAAAAIWLIRQREPAAPITYSPIPLTTNPGFETMPAFSPDGNQVAFMGSPEVENNFDIYVKLVGAGSALRLTNHPAEDGGPAWSPDGRWIAFNRSLGPKEFHLIVVPALGGSERRLAVLPSPQRPSWSADGHWLAVTNCSGERTCHLELVSFESGEIRKLNYTSDDARDLDPNFSPDGRFLAFSRSYAARTQSIWVLPLARDYSAASDPKEITDRRANQRPVWVPDGSSLIYSRGDPPKLYRTPKEGGNAEHLAWASIGVQFPSVSPNKHRLAFARRLREVNIYSLTVDASGKAVGAPKLMVDSTQSEYCQMFSPDASKVAFQSDRSGDHEIWVCDANGSSCTQLTSFGQFAGSPFWSPDGQWIAFDAAIDGAQVTYVIPATGGKPRQLTGDRSLLPRWSHDGKWIYVLYNGKLHRIRPDGGEMKTISDAPVRSELESPDGKYVYYSMRVDAVRTPLRRIRLEDGHDEEILTDVAGRNFAITDKGIWFVSANADRNPINEIRFLDLQTKAIRTVFRLEKEAQPGFDVSPNGRQILFSQLDRNGADLMLVEGFR